MDTLDASPPEHDVGVYVTIGALGVMPASRPSGASLLLCRFGTRQRPFGGDDPNQWSFWNAPAQEFAQVIRARHLAACTPAPLASCPFHIGGGFNLSLRTGAPVLVHDQHAATLLSRDETTCLRTDALRTRHRLAPRRRLAVLLNLVPPLLKRRT